MSSQRERNQEFVQKKGLRDCDQATSFVSQSVPGVGVDCVNRVRSRIIISGGNRASAFRMAAVLGKRLSWGSKAGSTCSGINVHGEEADAVNEVACLPESVTFLLPCL